MNTKKGRKMQQLGDTIPRLRCWQDRALNLHLASNRLGGQELVQAVEALKEAPRASIITLPVDPTPFPEEKNPVWRAGVLRLFSRLKLDRVDDPSDVQYYYTHALDQETAEVRLGKDYISTFLEACERMANGDGDFAIGLENLGITRKKKRKLKSMDRETRYVVFWGEDNIHGVNTF